MKKFIVVKKDDQLLELVNDTETVVDGEVLEEFTADQTKEKHVPYVEEKEDGYYVRVGKEQDHPMTEAHYILFIELIIDGERLHRQYLKPGQKPEAYFKVEKGSEVVAREYCNLHGLWKA
jgi:superoxide reductase